MVRGSDEVLHLRKALVQLQAELDEAYETISEMDFELDNVDILEIENQWLRDKLKEVREKSVWEDVGDVPHRNTGERQSARYERRLYRQNVACGMHGQSLKNMARGRRYGGRWDGSIIAELLRCCDEPAPHNYT